MTAAPEKEQPQVHRLLQRRTSLQVPHRLPAVPANRFRNPGILDGLGGRQNIDTLDNCVTRLRVEVKDSGAVKDDVLKAAGAKAVVRTGANSVQVVIGLKVQKVADELRKIL